MSAKISEHQEPENNTYNTALCEFKHHVRLPEAGDRRYYTYTSKFLSQHTEAARRNLAAISFQKSRKIILLTAEIFTLSLCTLKQINES